MKIQLAIASRCGLLLWGAALLAPAFAEDNADQIIDQAITAGHRDPIFKSRDRYRHPGETLKFFGLRPDMSVVEIWPAAGWYTEILAPVLRDSGTYHAATFVLTPESSEYQRGIHSKFLEKVKAAPDLYGKVKLTELGPGRMEIAPAGSADLVLTFRNVHNWMKGGFAEDAFKSFHAALKPGGVLGVVEHRAKPGTPMQKMIDSGYVTEEQVISLASAAGFKLEEKSEINANAADTTQHERGVWTLPPAFALCREVPPGPEQDKCRQPWEAIGESDRMTLRFRKPG